MKYKGYNGLLTRKIITDRALYLFNCGDPRNLTAAVKYNDPNWDNCPEVVLNISRKQDGFKGEHTLWVEFPVHDSDEMDNIWIYRKTFDNDDIKNAIDSFFKKAEDTERMFDIELEVWY